MRSIIRKPAPYFRAIAYYNNSFKEISLTDYRGKYLVLFFYPFDFSELCHREIIAFSEA
jgi:peroxiredoxin (alkyl hydroperoxide reductase subunit C)